MTWLDPPNGPAEAALRQALDAAAARTGDEIARRRVWTRIASPFFGEGPRPWLMRGAIAAVLVAGAVGALLVWPGARRVDLPAPGSVAVGGVPAAVASPAVTPPVAAVPVKENAPRRLIAEAPTTVRTRARERAQLRLWNGTEADLEPNSVLRVDERRRATIDKGRVSLAVPPQKTRRFAITAGPYLIAVMGTKFHLRVAGDSVGVDVEEGQVDVYRRGHVVRVEAGTSWTSPSAAVRRSAVRRWRPGESRGDRMLAAAPVGAVTLTSAAPQAVAPQAVAPAAAEARAPVAPAAPAVMPDLFREAQAALGEGKPQRALELLEGLSRGHGPAAQNAAYEVGRVLRDYLVRPRQAVIAWNRYRTRFPAGLLRAEADLSIIETLWTLRENSAAVAEAEAFLERHPASERRAEISGLVERIKADAARAVSRGETDSPGSF